MKLQKDLKEVYPIYLIGKKKIEEKNEILFEITYGKHKKHLFTTKSARSVKNINYEKKEENKK